MWAIVCSIIIIAGLSLLVIQKYSKPQKPKTSRGKEKQVTEEDIEIEKIKSKRPPPGI